MGISEQDWPLLGLSLFIRHHKAWPKYLLTLNNMSIEWTVSSYCFLMDSKRGNLWHFHAWIIPSQRVTGYTNPQHISSGLLMTWYLLYLFNVLQPIMTSTEKADKKITWKLWSENGLKTRSAERVHRSLTLHACALHHALNRTEWFKVSNMAKESYGSFLVNIFDLFFT